jgi:hypothetical protein
MGTSRGMVKDSQIMLQFATFIFKSRFGIMGTHVNAISPVKATGQAIRKFPLHFTKWQLMRPRCPNGRNIPTLSGARAPSPTPPTWVSFSLRESPPRRANCQFPGAGGDHRPSLPHHPPPAAALLPFPFPPPPAAAAPLIISLALPSSTGK